METGILSRPYADELRDPNEKSVISNIRDYDLLVQYHYSMIIWSILNDLDAKRHKDNRVKLWVNKVEEVQDWIEDAKTTSLILIEEARTTKYWLLWWHKKRTAEQKLKTQARKIYGRIHEIIKIISNGQQQIIPFSNLPARPLHISDNDESEEVVGLAHDQRIVIEQLTDPTIWWLTVISVVGDEGSGKTTLARKVYNRVRSHFAIHLWVTLSKDDKMIDILFKMLQEITQVDWEMRQKGEEYLLHEINRSLKEKRYLVVLDDVCSSDFWTNLQGALCKNSNGCRMLITTRFSDVAKEMSEEFMPHEIKALNQEESQQLLVMRVFSNQYGNEFPEDVLPMVREIATQSSGQPLDLLKVGDFLSRFPNYMTWSEILRVHKNKRQIDGSGFTDIISNYEHLPILLRRSFMYFAAFPKDYQIEANMLKSLWIAEGFIWYNLKKYALAEIAEGFTLRKNLHYLTNNAEQFTHQAMREDYIAEDYLRILEEGCMLQVSRENVEGKMKYCHVDVPLRELAIHKAKEDNFLVVLTNNGNPSSGGSSARRAALNFCDNMALQSLNKDLRVLHYVGDEIPNCGKFLALRVLRIHSSRRCTENGIEWLKNMIALRYLELRMDDDMGCTCMLRRSSGSAKHRVGFLLSVLTHLKLLETVHIEKVCRRDGNLPPSFWNNYRLRHVIFGFCRWCDQEVEGPPPPLSAHFPKLLTLRGVTARKDWLQWVTLPAYLRKLELNLSSTVELDPMLESLTKLLYLRSLSLRLTIVTRIEFPFLTSCLSKQRLYSLCLEQGRWPNSNKEVTNYSNMLPHLLKLTLSCFHFEEDPMPLLENLPKLKVLKVLDSRITAKAGNQMICSKRGFGCLQRLILQVIGLEEWKIEEDAMPLLNQLELKCYNDMEKVPDFQFLHKLQELKILRVYFNVPFVKQKYSIISKIEIEDHWRIDHVPSVQFL